VSVDFFVVPTIRFQILYVFVVLTHERHRIVHFAVTAHPTAEWTAQQMREAFPWDAAPRYLLRDRDRIFGHDFVKQVKAMGIKQVLSAARSPWQRAYVERAVGTIRRECLDHFDRVQREKPVPAPANLRGILPSEPRSLSIGERYSGAPTDPAAGVWPDCLDAGAGRAASPLRAARRLSVPTTDACLRAGAARSAQPLFVVTELRAGPTLEFLIPHQLHRSTRHGSEFSTSSISVHH